MSRVTYTDPVALRTALAEVLVKENSPYRKRHRKKHQGREVWSDELLAILLDALITFSFGHRCVLNDYGRNELVSAYLEVYGGPAGEISPKQVASKVQSLRTNYSEIEELVNQDENSILYEKARAVEVFETIKHALAPRRQRRQTSSSAASPSAPPSPFASGADLYPQRPPTPSIPCTPYDHSLTDARHPSQDLGAMDTWNVPQLQAPRPTLAPPFVQAPSTSLPAQVWSPAGSANNYHHFQTHPTSSFHSELLSPSSMVAPTPYLNGPSAYSTISSPSRAPPFGVVGPSPLSAQVYSPLYTQCYSYEPDDFNPPPIPSSQSTNDSLLESLFQGQRFYASSTPSAFCPKPYFT